MVPSYLIYHVDIFISVFGISQEAFWWCEAVFLVWNSINDLAYGWASDSESLASQGPAGRVSSATLQKRFRALSRGGPCFCAASLL